MWERWGLILVALGAAMMFARDFWESAVRWRDRYDHADDVEREKLDRRLSRAFLVEVGPALVGCVGAVILLLVGTFAE